MVGQRIAQWTSELEHNIETKIQQLRKDKITGMSIENLKQVTPTTGTYPVGFYHNQFASIAASVAKRLKFELFEF